MNIIREKNGLAIVELESEAAKRYYVVRISWDRGQCYSVVPNDMPPSGCWFAGKTDGGVQYVASARTWDNARRWFNKLDAVAENER